MSDWKVAPVTVQGPSGSRVIAAWVNGPFALDWRPIHDEVVADEVGEYGAWAVTHVRTGYSAGAVVGTFDDAARFADTLAIGADWDFDDPTDAKSRADAVKAAIRGTGAIRISGASVQMPPFATGAPA